MEEALARAWEQLAGRVDGPMWFRFLMQPAIAIGLAVRAGLRDAAANRSAYLWAVVSNPSVRQALLREGWKDIGRLCVIAFALDSVYQLVVLHRLYPLQALIVMSLLAVVPYLLVRGPVRRAARRTTRRAHLNSFFVAVLLLTAASATAASDAKYGISVKVDKHFDFSKLKTYCWNVGWPAYDKATDQQIVAAVDRQLAARGLTKLTGEPCDVIAKYRSLQRTDVDLDSEPFPGTGLRGVYAVGTLFIVLREPRSRREVFRARVAAPLESEPSKRAVQIDAAIARIFKRYPVERMVRP
jgi:hypothetical protein